VVVCAIGVQSGTVCVGAARVGRGAAPSRGGILVGTFEQTSLILNQSLCLIEKMLFSYYKI